MKTNYKTFKPVYTPVKHTVEQTPKSALTYGRAIVFGIASELILFVVQYLLLFLYYNRHPGSAFSFTTEYMATRGFYVFLIPGFILFATIVYFIMRRYTVNSAAYLFVFLLTAAVLEVAFYLSIAASYRGPFVYSVLDKVIGTALGVIGYYAIGRTDNSA
jgi:hypothetical protein